MNRAWLYPVAMLLLVGLGYGAFTLGQALRPKPPLGGAQLETPVPVGHLNLTGPEGEAVALGSFAGEHLLVFFGFTRCPDVCPLTLARLAALYRDLGEPAGVRVLMVTVDPAFDTPEAVQAYASGFHSSFVGLGGSNPQVAEAARTFYVGFGGAAPELVHTDAVFLVDPQSRMRAIYTQPNLDALREDLRRLLGG